MVPWKYLGILWIGGLVLLEAIVISTGHTLEAGPLIALAGAVGSGWTFVILGLAVAFRANKIISHIWLGSLFTGVGIGIPFIVVWQQYFSETPCGALIVVAAVIGAITTGVFAWYVQRHQVHTHNSTSKPVSVGV